MTAAIRKAIVEEARCWLGTPFAHCAARKGYGCDCVGLLIGSFGAVFGLEYTAAPYSRQVSEAKLKAELGKYFKEIDQEKLQAGDVVLLRVMNHPQHVAIYTGEGT